MATNILDGMREDAKQKAKKEGKEEGMQQGMQQVVLRLFSKKFEEVSGSVKTQIEELSSAELEQLSEDLLDFQHLNDFDAWLLKKLN